MSCVTCVSSYPKTPSYPDLVSLISSFPLPPSRPGGDLNVLRTGHPVVRDLIVDCLRHWAQVWNMWNSPKKFHILDLIMFSTNQLKLPLPTVIHTVITLKEYIAHCSSHCHHS